MAAKLGIKTAETKANIFSQKHHTFLSKIFDRMGKNERIHFASAITLPGYKDGYNHIEGGSYLELVELIERYGSNPDEDIRELWRRIVFSVAGTNTDDHLRNHCFLLKPKGWRPTPAYDIKPNENGTGLSLNISNDDNSLDFGLCLDFAGYFR
jgi:serine/threonine-protein kinase HipA